MVWKSWSATPGRNLISLTSIWCSLRRACSRLLLLLVAVLSPVHDLADDGAGGGRDLDQVEATGAGQRQGFLDRDDADLAAVGIDETDRREPDHLVDSCSIAFVSDGFLLLPGAAMLARRVPA